MFQQDKKAITFIPWGCGFSTYGPLSHKLWCQGQIPSPWYSKLGAHWVYKDTLQFAMSFGTDGKTMVNIYGLQPTSTPPLHVLSSFSVPLQSGEFSFSPATFHASFVTKGEVIILDVHNSKLLLQTKVSRKYGLIPGQFSHDGCFFVYRISDHGICVWENTPTGYVFWSTLKPRLPYQGFSWSPTSISILCWGERGVQLLCPDNNLNPPSPTKFQPQSGYGNHLVLYSIDGTHIVTARQDGGIVTVLDRLLIPPQQFIDADMQIHNTSIVDNAEFTVDMNKLSSQRDGMLQDGYYGGGVVLSGTSVISDDMGYIASSCNHSQIAFSNGGHFFLYDVKTQKAIEGQISDWPSDIQFSLGGHQPWSVWVNNDHCCFIALVDPIRVPKGGLGWSKSLLHFSYGSYLGKGSGWVEDLKGNKLLWFPPAWREEYWREVGGDGNFLVSLSSHHPEPIIIKFQL